ncbi:MAG: hypothetical protein WKG01_42560 [Kofleriaceae bacterium]
MLATLAASAGCGLISSDVTNFDLTLPDKSFTIDTASWEIDGEQAETLLQTNCSSAPSVCNSVAQQACAMDCAGSCNPDSQTCVLELKVGLYRPIDLVMERPELKSINDEPVIKVTLDSVTYEITTNTLNVDTPVLTLYVAPMSVMEPSDPQAKAIGTIEPVTAGMTTETPAQITFTATGKADLVAMMNSFKTPFNVIVGSTLLVQAGTPLPSGKLDAVVHIKAHAGL